MFSKKIIVLKQTADGFSYGIKSVCGICRLEKENDVLTVFLSPIGFSALNSGSYRLFIIGDNKTLLSKDLGKIPTSSTMAVQSELPLNKGVSVGIWSVKDDIPLLVAYQKSEDAKLSLKDYGTTVINEIINERKLREREKEFAIEKKTLPTPLPNDKQSSKADFSPSPTEEFDKPAFNNTPDAYYNDEAVATANYFEQDDEIKQKLSYIKDLSDEYIRSKNDDGYRFSPQEESQSAKNVDVSENETNYKRNEKPYFLTVKRELDGIFNKFPAETTLENAFAGSRFAKVFYAENKFYVVGLIKENGKEKYICYGVPSVYRKTPPKELAGFCSFVPLSVFDLKGDGYFMMFQDAKTGKCVHKS